ncbi:MAG: succinylglutamate desuccinylase/aspartoacylase family protein [Gammaproteobacteria bacterium]|nr:succinylglutamate desuccinylase/aspartoacylase family protein [Gammaproteobacteria bacterium]MBT8151950.1 succinylglutamate desuccinylase/aspartoacylase family protein [Gammaproteobacteria bacterium]NND39147.1 succinylglutamate desuccinylase/aspartoacylase family protein [Pseudomonadales bacterium]NNL10613.1 succinylglutamate desuccinylase/aspartoacylase family protein [Pseudomonadales bacterium]NNM11636.1 succinylglutamate desuccinylase/aspartoacylase family protein [Pseudomonadales bacteri
MPRDSFTICGEEIAPGARATLSLPLPSQSSYTPLSMPVHIVHGKKAGPVVFVSAAIHGDEINGIEIIRRVLKNKSLSRLSGTLICVPIVNVYGFFNHTRYLPDGRDLNRSFPGSKSGSLAARVARIFAEEIVDKATHGIDLHTGANHRANLPHIRANLDSEECAKLAKAFGSPVVIGANLRDGSLRQYALEKGLSMLLYEAGEGLRFDNLSIKAGVRGVFNVLRELEMLPRKKPSAKAAKKPAKKHEVIETRSSQWVRAPQAGLFRIEAPLGARVEADAVIGRIADSVGENETPVISPVTGIVIGRTNLPVVNEGDALFHIARFENSRTVKKAIDNFQDLHIEGLTSGDYPDSHVI